MFITPTLSATAFDARRMTMRSGNGSYCGSSSSYCGGGGFLSVSSAEITCKYSANSCSSSSAAAMTTTTTMMTLSRRGAKNSPKDTVKRRFLAKIVKMITSKDKSDSTPYCKAKCCFAQRGKPYSTARWRRFANGPKFSTPRSSLGSLSLNFEPLLPTIVEETESELKDELA